MMLAASVNEACHITCGQHTGQKECLWTADREVCIPLLPVPVLGHLCATAAAR